MTREKHLAARSAAYRAASLLTGALMVAALSGCGGGLFQISDTADASLGQKVKPAVAIAPVQGVPQKYASKVNEQILASVKAKGVQVVDAKDAQYVIKPVYLALPEPKKGTKVTYAIDVTDKAGNRVRRIEGEELVSEQRGGDAWGHVTDESVLRVAAKSATDVNAWIENPGAPAAAASVAVANAAPAKSAPVAATAPATKTAAAKPIPQPVSLAAAVDASAAAPAKPASAAQTAAASPGELVVMVPTVTGAPGDGKTALTEAMKRALGKQGMKLAASAKPGAYKIQGQVEMGPTSNGEQSITIRWVVVDPSGKQMEKTIVQSNKVESGKLDKTWGEVADLAANGAAIEVAKLLGRAANG